MFSDSLVGGWQHVPFEIRHPSEMPVDIRRVFVVGFEQAGEPEDVVPAAVRAGVFLTLPQLRTLQGHLKFDMPTQGHGKRGRLIKEDWGRALIHHFFGNESQEEKDAMLRGILGKQWRHLDAAHASRHTTDILRAFEGLEPEDQAQFQKLAAVASDEVLLKNRRDYAAREVDPTKVRTRQHQTPSLLQDLLPSSSECRITRHPKLKRYQAFYGT